MDSIDDIEDKNNRNLQTAEMVSAYMRANAQRSAQRAAQQRLAPEVTPDEVPPKDSEADKLDFSSEFSTGDMGLNSQGGSAELMAFKRAIEEEDEDEDEERERDDEDEDEQAQEWQGGRWGEKQPDHEAEPEEDESETVEAESPADDIIPAPRNYVPSSVRPVVPNLMPPPAATPPAPTAPPPPRAKDVDLESAQSFWGAPAAAPAPAPAAAPAPPRPAPPPGRPEEPTPTVPLALPTVAAPLQATPPAAYSLPERLRPAPQIELPSSGQMAQVDPTLAQLAGKLILNGSEQPGYEECVRLLSRFGNGALRICGREKVRVEILDDSEFPSHPGLQAMCLAPDDTPTDGAYLVDSRLVLVNRRCLTGRPRFFHPALYYFAHAFDHAQGGETFSSRKAAAVIACYEASTRAYNGFDFVDELAAADPVRYFARSVAVYLGRDDCDDPLWSHQDLFDFDRSMYDYLQYLFARLNG